MGGGSSEKEPILLNQVPFAVLNSTPMEMARKRVLRQRERRRARSAVEKVGRFFTALDIGLRHRSGDELICDCVWCGKEAHLYLNPVKGVFHCKRCDHRGRYADLLKHIADQLGQEISRAAFDRLAGDRGLPVEAFAGHGFGFTGKRFTLPSLNRKRLA